MPKLCLNMIVKNESHIIGQTLRNLAQTTPIDYWVICDTGSTDNTMEIIGKTMAELGIPGELYQDKWVNFSHNRNLALNRASGKAQHLLLFDADDMIQGYIEWPETFTHDAYSMNMTVESGVVNFRRTVIVKDGSASWRGAVHEFIEIPSGDVAHIPGDYAILARTAGARSQNPNRFREDAQMLESVLARNEDPDLRGRYLFYAGQSWRDAGDLERSISYHLQNIDEPTGWSEEKYMSALEIAAYHEGRQEYAQSLYYWSIATQVNPNRPEAWYHLSRLNSWQGRYEIAYVYATKAYSARKNKDGLFLNNDIHAYWATYELFIEGSRTGQLNAAYQAFKQLVVTDAPVELYAREVATLQSLRPYIEKDDYLTSKTIKEVLLAKGQHEVVRVLFL